jgi:hypothetical protein
MIFRLALVLLLAGCNDGPTNGSCQASCGTCSSNQICFGADGFFGAQCARTCHSSDDCSSSDKCLAVTGEPGPVCLGSTPSPCVGYTPNCTRSRTTCVDANTLSQLVDPTSCAFEQKTCKNGCTADHCN